MIFPRILTIAAAVLLVSLCVAVSLSPPISYSPDVDTGIAAGIDGDTHFVAGGCEILRISPENKTIMVINPEYSIVFKGVKK